ncbi:MAG TPA: response regulator [Polyangiaceae bacterium]|jgi:CheY-like chemotaxis protein|nr:response regulator [Polyangiaceae bacterium]
MSHASESRSEQLVLHVEDNGDHADLVKRCLSRHRPESRIVRVEDGEAALEYLSRSDAATPRPLLILLDLRLPKVDGIDVLRAVKTTPELATIPVVVLTTSDSESDVARAYEHHVNSYLVKPDDFLVLDSMMKDLGDYWLDWNVQPAGGP